MTTCPIVLQQAQKARETQIKHLLEKVRVLMGNRIMPDGRSTTEQLQDLIFIANQVGLYDAADAVQRLIKG